MRVGYSTLVKAKRAGRATAVRVAPTGTAVEQYQVPLGQRHSLKEAGVIGLPSWSDKTAQSETWTKVPRLSATCPRRVVAFDGGKGDIDQTMEFGDEFNGTSINAVKWASYSGVTVSGGKALLDQNETLVSSTTRSRPAAIVASFETTNVSNAWGGGIAFGDGIPLAAYSPAYYVGIYNGSWYLIHSTASAISLNQDLGIAGSINTRYTAEIALTATQVIVRVWAIGGTRPASPTYSYTNATLDAKAIRFGHTGPSRTQKVDVGFVRKFIPSEPLAGTVVPSTTNRALSRPMSHADLMRACCT